MSDEIELPELTDEEAAKIGKQKIRLRVKEGGKVTKHVVCQSCGQKNSVVLAQDDPDELLRMTKFLEDSARQGRDDTAGKAQAHAQKLREMSTEELWDLYVATGGTMERWTEN